MITSIQDSSNPSNFLQDFFYQLNVCVLENLIFMFCTFFFDLATLTFAEKDHHDTKKEKLQLNSNVSIIILNENTFHPRSIFLFKWANVQ